MVKHFSAARFCVALLSLSFLTLLMSWPASAEVTSADRETAAKLQKLFNGAKDFSELFKKLDGQLPAEDLRFLADKATELGLEKVPKVILKSDEKIVFDDGGKLMLFEILSSRSLHYRFNNKDVDLSNAKTPAERWELFMRTEASETASFWRFVIPPAEAQSLGKKFRAKGYLVYGASVIGGSLFSAGVSNQAKCVELATSINSCHKFRRKIKNFTQECNAVISKKPAPPNAAKENSKQKPKPKKKKPTKKPSKDDEEGDEKDKEKIESEDGTDCTEYAKAQANGGKCTHTTTNDDLDEDVSEFINETATGLSDWTKQWAFCFDHSQSRLNECLDNIAELSKIACLNESISMNREARGGSSKAAPPTNSNPPPADLEAVP